MCATGIDGSLGAGAAGQSDRRPPRSATPRARRDRADSVAGALPVLLTVRVGNHTTGNVLGLDAGGMTLLSARGFLQLAGAQPVRRGSRLTGRLSDDEAPVEIDIATGRLRAAGRRLSAAPGQLREVDGIIYVALPLLAELLQITPRYHT
ncbi:MAG: hypothetical protein M3154_05180, partial [Candidatus Eremiobacteraeota bacterium]|nr:hypothetical protein [Candidatus Eremiobacteraeota bacterium]